MDAYEKACKKIRKANADLLAAFESWLQKKKLGKKTVDKHLANTDFFINHFLLYEEAIKASDGLEHVGHFLGYWFIRKAMWANQQAIIESAASLKKFYTFLWERGEISKEFLTNLKIRIKEEMPEWLATMDRYEDPENDDPWELGIV